LASAPARRPWSVRRTSHVDVTRAGAGTANGRPLAAAVSGVARDLLTSGDGGEVVGTASLVLTMDAAGRIDSADHEPSEPLCALLVGQRPGFGFRSATKELQQALTGTLLGLLIDDLSGAPAPASYGAIREQLLLRRPEPVSPGDEDRREGRVDVCAGWRADGLPTRRRKAGLPLPFSLSASRAPSLDGPDALAWHGLPALASRQSRRLRRLDLWRNTDGRLWVDAMFRDTAVDPDLTEAVVHEYSLAAVIDPVTLTVLSAEAAAGPLPFADDCPLAADSAQLIIGQPVTSLRSKVGAISRGPGSCTHLNDLLRSLGDVGELAKMLPGFPAPFNP
jgi:Protein of unknown function (DUF2889)